ncbi:MAG: anti-sigma factor [Rhizobiales bacterium]|nr:anti-sigma factor [Hyphomicrobiales bacterium]
MNSEERGINEMADEYVLGLLDATDHAAMEARLEHDAALRAAVGASRDRFLELDLAAESTELSPGIWNRIAAQLGGRGVANGGRRPLTALMKPANDNTAIRWRSAAFAFMATSFLFAVALGWSFMAVPEPRVIAVLMNEAGVPLVVVEDYGSASARITPLADFDVPEGRTMQVWTLPSQELGAVSLGLLKRSETVMLEGPVLPEPRAEQLYEITLEQEGGSPTGRPTGPVLVKGFAKIPR